MVIAAALFSGAGVAAVAVCAGTVAFLTRARAGAGPGALLLSWGALLLAGVLLGRLLARERRARRRAAAVALIDRLTGLHAYAAFTDALHRELDVQARYGGSLTLIMLDVDHFKRFNDRYGHEAGNRLLARLGAALRSLLRGADLVARYGGEEFAVLIHGDELDGLRLAERIRAETARLRIAVDGGLASVTVSAGVAACRAGEASASELVEAADQALYESKQAGRDCISGHTLGTLRRTAQQGLRAVGA